MLRSVGAALVALLLLAGLALTEQSAQALEVHGKLALPDGFPLAQAEVALALEGGGRLLAFPLPDGAFSFAEVPAGVHTLSVEVPGLMYPTLRLDVGAARRGKIAATAVDAAGAPALAYPLLLRPFGRVDYFEQRQPFSVWGFLKTPYGMMAGFMVFSIFIMPKLKMDPEDIKEIMGDKDKEKEKEKAVQPSSSSGRGGRHRSD